MTNREWLKSLTDHQLSEFLTHGLLVNYKGNSSAFFKPFYLSINQIMRDYMSSSFGIEKWLKENQNYEVIK